MPTCSKCKQEKPLDDFHKRKDSKRGHRSHCKVCTNERNLFKYHTCNKTAKSHHLASRKHLLRVKYNLTLEDYETLLEKQGGVCYICGGEEERIRSRKFSGTAFLCVDHCHKTGKVRKLLCNNCNGALGQVKENLDTLQKMILYLEEHRE